MTGNNDYYWPTGDEPIHIAEVSDKSIAKGNGYMGRTKDGVAPHDKYMVVQGDEVLCRRADEDAAVEAAETLARLKRSQRITQ